MAAGSPEALIIREGSAYALFAWDVGLAIDLDAAAARLPVVSERAGIRHKRRAPRSFDFDPPPLRITEDTEPLRVGAWTTEPAIDCVLFEFGAILVGYRVSLAGPLDDLVGLAATLGDDPALLADSRCRVAELVDALHLSVTRPVIDDLVESYAILEIRASEPALSAADLVSRHAGALAAVLRSERAPLADSAVADALDHRISFGPDDLTIVDWDAALLFDRDAGDVRAVLEFANVELLEMRWLDRRLDAALEEAWERLSRRQRSVWPGTPTADLRRIGQSQVDSAILFEGVTNALKLLGDQYLARVYRLVSRRFHLAEWDAGITRKLAMLDSIHEKMSNLAANRRIEVLEWIIIILIALEIILMMLPAAFGLALPGL